MRKKISILLAGVLLAGCVSGCSDMDNNTQSGESVTSTEEVSPESVEQEAASNKIITDNRSLYENQEDTSVITMYLTVSQGNESDNTNHTWEEINTHSVYDYDEMGVDRYAVSGLLQVGDENGPTEGELGYGQVTPNASVTVRGQTSSRYAQKSYKIKLKDGKGSWNDQTTINLNKHQEDGMRFRNKMMYDLMETMPGMIALQTQFVHLYVKDNTEGSEDQFTDYGLYTQVEQSNKGFLKRHGLDSNGELYKINYFEFYRYEDTIMLKSDADYDQKKFEDQLEIKGSDDHSNLIAMLDAVNDYSVPIEEVLEDWFEEDNLMSWLAFQILTGNNDTQSRNTLLYSPLNTNYFYFISWDNDVAFSRTEEAIKGKTTDDGWDTGISNYWGNVLFQRILKSDTLRADLDDKIEEERALITENRLTEMVNNYASVVKNYVYSQPDLLHEPLTESEYDEVCQAIPKEAEENYQLYLASLDRPMPFFIGTPEVSDTGTEFNWDASYDFDNEDIAYSFELADNPDFNHPIVSEDNMFLTEYSYADTLAPGQYFVRVKATNESGQEQYAFDYYLTPESQRVYGTKCFYVLDDGSIVEETYED